MAVLSEPKHNVCDTNVSDRQRLSASLLTVRLSEWLAEVGATHSDGGERASPLCPWIDRPVRHEVKERGLRASVITIILTILSVSLLVSSGST